MSNSMVSMSALKRGSWLMFSNTGSYHLDGHLAILLEIGGEIDDGHAAGTEFVLDGVAILTQF